MAHSSHLSIKEQVKTAIGNLPKRFKAEAFFSLFSSIFKHLCSLDVLKRLMMTLFPDPWVVGISIGTRPDCLDEEKLDLIASYKNPWLELGLQSAHNKTLKLINGA